MKAFHKSNIDNNITQSLIWQQLFSCISKEILLYTSNYDLLEKKKPFYNRMTSSAWQRPTLTGGSPLLPSALKNLTSVFGMGTGVTSSPSLPDKLSLFAQNWIKPTLKLKIALRLFNLYLGKSSID